MTANPPDRRHIVWQDAPITRQQREQRNGHAGLVVWLTGLPGSGKTSVAAATQLELHRQGRQTVWLDGDNLRHGLCADLGFSISDRNENVRRAGEVARLLLAQGFIVLVSMVSPVRSARDQVMQSMLPGDMLEIWCHCPPEVCARRDPKGHYRKAQDGLITHFTGVSSAYEEPLEPALVLHTASDSLQTSVQRLLARMALHRVATA